MGESLSLVLGVLLTGVSAGMGESLSLVLGALLGAGLGRPGPLGTGLGRTASSSACSSRKEKVLIISFISVSLKV